MASGFAPMYLSRMYGVQLAKWGEFVLARQRELRAAPAAERAAIARGHRPVMSARSAVEVALLAYPSAERFLTESAEEPWPFRLRDDVVYQPNVSLDGVEIRAPGGGWRPLDCELDELGLPAETAALRAVDVVEQRDAREDLRAPGVYPLGHSSLLIRGERSGVLIDPIFESVAQPGALRTADVDGLVDAVLLTHGHFDHYHLPTLLRFRHVPIVCPPVPRASVVCEDIAGRLRSLGHPDVRVGAWHSEHEIGALDVRVLPFWGEQFLTCEVWPQARNWGNCYAVDVCDTRVLVAADAGFERAGSILEAAGSVVDGRGGFDLVLTQALGLVPAFGGGDPDLQIPTLTRPDLAGRCIELLDPVHRCTLAIDDLPALCARLRVGRLALYGQFAHARGALASDPRATAAAAAALLKNSSPAQVVQASIGERVLLSRADRMWG